MRENDQNSMNISSKECTPGRWAVTGLFFSGLSNQVPRFLQQFDQGLFEGQLNTGDDPCSDLYRMLESCLFLHIQPQKFHERSIRKIDADFADIAFMMDLRVSSPHVVLSRRFAMSPEGSAGFMSPFTRAQHFLSEALKGLTKDVVRDCLFLQMRAQSVNLESDVEQKDISHFL